MNNDILTHIRTIIVSINTESIRDGGTLNDRYSLQEAHAAAQVLPPRAKVHCSVHALFILENHRESREVSKLPPQQTTRHTYPLVVRAICSSVHGIERGAGSGGAGQNGPVEPN